MERADLEQWKAREVARLLALVETERRYYQEIIATLPVGLLVVAGDLSIISANRAIRKIFALRGGSVRGRLDSLVPDSVLDQVRQVLTSGNPQTDLSAFTELNGGRVLRIGIQPIQNWDEGEQEALLTIEDVTDLQQAYQAQGAPLASPVSTDLIENLEATVWAIEIPSMKVLFLSKQVRGLLGFETAHWLETADFWKERVHPDDRDSVLHKYDAALAAPSEQGAHIVCEYRAITADGNAIWVRETARALHDAGGRPEYLVGITSDVTQRRLLEAQLVQSNRVDAAGKLAARLAHDLNNMLMILTGYGEELLSHFPAGNPLRADVQEILTATERVNGLTSQLLAFTRRPPASPSAIDLSAALKAMHPSLREALEPGIELELATPPQPVAAKADLTQWQQVVGAFVRRAREVMPQGGTFSVRVSTVTITEDLQRPDTLRPGDYAVLTLRDTGPRYDTEARAALFESFLPGKEPPGENGLLLSRAYASVRQWGGDIAVSDASGKGSVFEIFLPLVSDSVPTVTPAVEPPAAALSAQPKPETILVVEDEGGIRSLVRKILRRQGYEVLEAANGKQALEICAQHAGIDLLVTDVLMPEMGGRELVEQLRRNGRPMKVLYVSGYTDDPSIYSAELSPGTAFLQKPFTLGSLLEKVKEVLAARLVK